MEIYVLRHGLTELNKQGKVNGEIDEPLAREIHISTYLLFWVIFYL